ncbi:MAG: hypothetical protein JXB03_03430 [Spirochaetales bacterium]|nr:hypothetical protein [Spirochaetales bacterium]
MVITINETVADISIEHEQSLKEVIDGLDTWLKKEGFFLSAALVNGKAVSLDNEDLKEVPVSQVDTLDVFAHELKELVLENVGTLYQYLYLLATNIKEGNPRHIQELISELPFILSSMDAVLGSEEGSFSGRLNELVQNAGFKDGVPEAPVNELSEYLNTLILFLENLIKEKTNPEKEFFKAVRALDTSIPGLRDIAVLLQTGKDREAMNRVIAFSEITAKMTRLFPLMKENGVLDTGSITIEGQSFKEFYSGLNSFLSQILEALENEDSVLIGDLLEYEIAPRIEALVGMLEDHQSEKEFTSP